MINQDTNKVELFADREKVEVIWRMSNAIYLGILEDLCSRFEIDIDLERYWNKL